MKSMVARGGSDSGPKLVTAYIAALPKDARAALTSLRKTIKAAAPMAVETISYGMPAFKHKGVLVYYAAFKEHYSLFPASVAVVRRFEPELRSYETSKGTIRFAAGTPVPVRLVTRIVKARIAENEARQVEREKPKRNAG